MPGLNIHLVLVDVYPPPYTSAPLPYSFPERRATKQTDRETPWNTKKAMRIIPYDKKWFYFSAMSCITHLVYTY